MIRKQPCGMQRPDMAPVAGCDEDGPQPLPRSGDYEGGLPVFQGEIDSHDFSTKSGTANLMIGEGNFRSRRVQPGNGSDTI